MLVNNSLLHGHMWDFPHIFAVQEEELPLNILCGSYLCCQWKLSLCICRTGNRIAAVQQLKFHFWAGLFSQWLSVSVLIKVLSRIPFASPLKMIASSQLIIRHCNTNGIWRMLEKCGRLLMSKWTSMRQSLTFATLLSVFFAPCSILKKRQPAVFYCLLKLTTRPEIAMLEKIEDMSSLVRTQASPHWTSACDSNGDHIPELPWVKDVHEHVQPLHAEIKIRNHVNKVCSLWLQNLVWDVLVFFNVIFAIFLRIYIICISFNMHLLICCKSDQNLVIMWHHFQSSKVVHQVESLALPHCLG